MRSRAGVRNTHNEENFWPSFTDLISTIALILFFLILIIFIKNIIIAEDLNNQEKRLLSTEEALSQREQEMAVLNAEISEKETNLMMLLDEAERLQAEVERGEQALKLSAQKILDQQMIIAESNQELGDMRMQIQQIAVFRVTILEQITKAIQNEMTEAGIEGGEEVYIGENGNIILNNKLLFQPDATEVGSDGEVLLAELSKVFYNVLNDPQIYPYIDAIQIEGHTDTDNTAEYNRTLSTERANSVVNFMFDSNEDLEAEYGDKFVASGYSEYRPLVEENTPEDKATNRRIEISIILKDSNIQEIIDNYLENTVLNTN